MVSLVVAIIVTLALTACGKTADDDSSSGGFGGESGGSGGFAGEPDSGPPDANADVLADRVACPQWGTSTSGECSAYSAICCTDFEGGVAQGQPYCCAANACLTDGTDATCRCVGTDSDVHHPPCKFGVERCCPGGVKYFGNVCVKLDQLKTQEDWKHCQGPSNGI